MGTFLDRGFSLPRLEPDLVTRDFLLDMSNIDLPSHSLQKYQFVLILIIYVNLVTAIASHHYSHCTH